MPAVLRAVISLLHAMVTMDVFVQPTYGALVIR
jgi:hypothetical protein